MARQKALRALFGTLLVYALLVATHLGEFWPFSIYPMFSQGGNDWSRVVVRDVSDAPTVRWDTLDVASLPGEAFALTPRSIDPIDLSNFVSKTTSWNTNRVAGLQQMFYDQIDTHDLLVLRVNGRLDDADSVRVGFVPYAYVSADTVFVNPVLPR